MFLPGVSSIVLQVIAVASLATAVLILVRRVLEALSGRRDVGANFDRLIGVAAAEPEEREVAILGSVPGDAGRLGRWLRAGGVEAPTRRIVSGVVLACVLVTGGTFIGTRSVIVAAALGMLPVGLMAWTVQRRVQARRSALSRQLVDMVDLLASSLRGGFGFVQAVEFAAREIGPPMSEVLIEMLQDIELGMSIEDALSHLDERLADPEVRLLTQAVLVQRRVGGDLGEVLARIGDTLRERMSIRREVATLTAQARGSAWVIGALPVVVTGALMLIQPAQMSVLFTTSSGVLILAVAAVLEVVGFIAVRRTASIRF